MKATFARGFAIGLRQVPGKNVFEKNQTRTKEFLNLLDGDRDLDDETIRDIVAEVYRHYFQSNCGAFFMAHRLRSAQEEQASGYENIKDKIRVVLTAVLEQMCRNLEMAHQIGEQAGESIDVAFWVAKQVNVDDPIAAARLMRTCGKGLSGEEVDQFFWELKEDLRSEWACLALTDGMLYNEGSISILSDYLVAKGRGPKLRLEE